MSLSTLVEQQEIAAQIGSRHCVCLVLSIVRILLHDIRLRLGSEEQSSAKESCPFWFLLGLANPHFEGTTFNIFGEENVFQ